MKVKIDDFKTMMTMEAENPADLEALCELVPVFPARQFRRPLRPEDGDSAGQRYVRTNKATGAEYWRVLCRLDIPLAQVRAEMAMGRSAAKASRQAFKLFGEFLACAGSQEEANAAHRLGDPVELDA